MQITRIEIHNFRRLRDVAIDLDAETTVLVGANNSGKTAAIAAMALFLRSQTGQDGQRLSVSDIHVASLPELEALGRRWLELSNSGAPDEDASDAWTRNQERLHDLLPYVELSLKVDDSELHFVSHLLPTLEWTSRDLIRVRIRCELAPDAPALRVFAERYRSTCLAIHGAATEAPTTWPRSFVDYLSKDFPEHPPSFAAWVVSSSPERKVLRRLEGKPLANLLRVDVIPAQRGLGSDEAAFGEAASDARMRGGLFTRRLVNHCSDTLKTSSEALAKQPQLARIIAQAERELDQGLSEALRDAMEELRELGYPSLRDPALVFRSQIRPEQLLNHAASVQYRTGVGHYLPEHSIGLGYQNLLMLSFTLVHFRRRRMLPAAGDKPRIHLVVAEEPEAHLHVQVQRAFIENARKFISKDEDAEQGLSAQLVASTHSSSIAHAVPFSQIRYFRREASLADTCPVSTTSVVNLTDTFGRDEQTRRFVERYLQVQHSDLFFADAAILVEGTAERVLLPLFIEDHTPPPSGEKLSRSYITTLPVGGSHAHRLRPLIDKLQLTTLVVTDLDPGTGKPSPPGTEQDSSGNTKNQVKPAVERQSGQVSTNPTLAKWLPATSDVDQLLSFGDGAVPDPRIQNHVRVAYQLPEASGPTGNPCGATFEDALILANVEWFRSIAIPSGSQENALSPAVRSVVRAVSSESINLPASLLKVLSGRSFEKAEFALDLFIARCKSDSGPWLRCPRYIREGLDWLSERLERCAPDALETDPTGAPHRDRTRDAIVVDERELAAAAFPAGREVSP